MNYPARSRLDFRSSRERAEPGESEIAHRFRGPRRIPPHCSAVTTNTASVIRNTIADWNRAPTIAAAMIEPQTTVALSFVRADKQLSFIENKDAKGQKIRGFRH